MPAAAPAFSDLLKSIKQGKFVPLYILHGEEGYFIDELTKAFEESVPESERDFNLYTFYAPEVKADTIIGACRRYPMMADHQTVIVKEAQAARADEINKLHAYVSTLNPSTVLVICFRGDKAKGKDLLAAARKANSVIFESKKPTGRNVDALITGIVRSKGLNIEPKGLAMLCDYLGTDAAKIYNEINKLAMVLSPGAMVTPESIERNIGVSKDYNDFELVDAIAARNAAKSFKILAYFRRNPKNCPAARTASNIFSYFASLLTAQFTRDKSPSSLMSVLGLKWDKQLTRFTMGMRNYNAYQTIEIIAALRRFDANIKGIGSRQNEYDLLHALLFKIFNARGDISF
ncbi:MAG: DNA polymerase III subunit delta [Firmicutes bacterium]|nr:DNA polymerase III subunit delta [Bacillota bacterium]MCM1400903.1 DNA polymerase III subunit delta [Bacteroides sp.]MCM1476556.1 DNA polymerase III subunit delta [Bacteroides sp.]